MLGRVAVPRAVPFARAAATATKPKRPSPYRLPHLSTFLPAFAPLHVAGWRLDRVPGATSAREPLLRGASDDVLSDGGDLQDRRLVRVWTFEPDREGWRRLRELLGEIGQAVETEDHHPSILVAPSSDVPRATSVLTAALTSSYVLHVSTHTHTPMPFSPYTDSSGRRLEFDGKPRPGVTGKDLQLAARLEAIWDRLRGVE
ncbi:hypothetical protein Q5752_002419 [Cryptotrichosporon argae]